MLRAIQTFWAGNRLVSAGEIVEASDPAVKGREVLFAEIVPTNVEQATSAPGEKRTRRPRAKRAPKAEPDHKGEPEVDTAPAVAADGKD